MPDAPIQPPSGLSRFVNAAGNMTPETHRLFIGWAAALNALLTAVVEVQTFLSGMEVGGTVTQATSKSTAVTLDTRVGVITTHDAALGANATVFFTVNCAAILAHDAPTVTVASPASRYRASCSAVADGAFQVALTNLTGSVHSDAVVLNVVAHKGAVS